MIFGQKIKLIIITIIKHHNSKHYIHSIFINTYDTYPNAQLLVGTQLILRQKIPTHFQTTRRRYLQDA
jgi:hypothetical protein